MRQGASETKGRARKPIAILSAFLMVAAVMVAFSQPTSAETKTTTKSVPMVCKGADDASRGLLDLIGGSIKANVDVEVTLPTELTPGLTGTSASFVWTTKLGADLANTAVGLGVKEVTISNLKMDVDVSGATSLKTIPGRPQARKVALQANTPIAVKAGPFTGEITDVGSSGFVRFKSTKVDMTVALSLAGVSQALNITCAAPATLGTVSIRVKGSPIVQNFTEILPTAGTMRTFDILGTAKPDKDDAGVEQPIVPESLKIVSGNGTVNEEGTISVESPAAGKSTEVVYQLCAPPVEVSPAMPGINEQQIIEFDKQGSEGFKRTVAFRLGFGEEESAPIWSVTNPLTGNVQTGPVPGNWQNNANSYLFHQFRFPRANEVKGALEGIPGIGAGNVQVDDLGRDPEDNSINRYRVTFIGALGEKDVPELEVSEHDSLPPQELLADLIALAGSLTGGGDDGAPTTTTTIPGGLSITDYYDQLMQQAANALNNGNFPLWLERTEEALGLIAANPTAFIDVQAAIAALSDLFPPGPVLSTEVPGEEPTPAEVQELCSTGVITLSTTAATQGPEGPTTNPTVVPPPPPGTPTGTGTGTAAGTGTEASSTTGAPLGITG